jgi:hypothetical protein
MLGQEGQVVVLLPAQHFQHGLSRDNVFRLLALTKGSLFHENPTEGLEILENILAMPIRREVQSEEIKDQSQS